ncbi:hypothetical protein Pla111_12810 [Botrimarina hoheduenensis]|uniref:Uncharacterized protein n=1 Tax=Botrimarina hoheduenensis TaxID=2528000 RepID=A0A5C5WDB1_9BACT|nr:hypothetical protein Pla111_12810 [Botrimarina hoheduenensis]
MLLPRSEGETCAAWRLKQVKKALGPDNAKEMSNEKNFGLEPRAVFSLRRSGLTL